MAQRLDHGPGIGDRFMGTFAYAPRKGAPIVRVDPRSPEGIAPLANVGSNGVRVIGQHCPNPRMGVSRPKEAGGTHVRRGDVVGGIVGPVDRRSLGSFVIHLREKPLGQGQEILPIEHER